MANEAGKMSGRRCRGCGWGLDVCESLTKRGTDWMCDPCIKWEYEADQVDVEGYEEKRRQRLAEAQEY